MKLLLAALVLLLLPSCESFPITAAYKTEVAGHEVNAAYSTKDGLIVAAEHLRVLTQK